jgi:Protein of unknown function (DUF3237)
MSTLLSEDLPDVLRSVRTRPMFVMRLDVPPLLIVGAAPGAFRRIGLVPGGSFEGERLSGEVLDGGSDWQTVMPQYHDFGFQSPPRLEAIAQHADEKEANCNHATIMF